MAHRAASRSTSRGARKSAGGPLAACALGLILMFLPGLEGRAQTPPPPEQGGAASAPAPDSGKDKKDQEKKEPKKKAPQAEPKKTSPEPRPSPSPAPDQKSAPTAKPSPQAPLSFTDDDLERFRKAAPPPEEEPAEEPSQAAGAGGTPPAPKPPAPGVVRQTKPPTPGPGASQYAPLVRTPLVIAKPPSQDPLKPFRDREARDKLRAQQIQVARDDVARIQSRLDYLKQKRLGITNPLIGMPKAQTDDERANDASLKPKDLLDQVDAEIKSLESDLEEARGHLVQLETRFGSEAESR